MDGERFEADSNLQLNKCASGVDRISQLPNEILFLILSFLPVRKAASTTVLSSRWLGLWKQIPNLKFNLESDRISQLPDQILLAILSLLTFKQVVATSVLSSRWSDLWKHNTRLDFYPSGWISDMDLEDDIPGRLLSGEECIEVVNSVIQSHKSRSLKLFRIAFSVKESAKCSVTKWLEFVFSREVEFLVLDFRLKFDQDMIVLEESLRESRICGAPQDLIFFKSLKRLCLGFLKVSGEDIKLFICNCSLLEYLKIQYATLTSDVEICGAYDLMLNHLVLSGCKGEKSIKVSAPNLTWISFSRNSAKLLFENVPRLAVASFQSADPDSLQQFAHISQLLHLRMDCPMTASWMDGFPQMPNLRELIIDCHKGYNYSLMQITAPIWASPRLKKFSLWNYVGDPQVLSVLTNGERSKHQNLQVFEFRMSSYESVSDDIVELVIYILDNCVALQQVKICRMFWDDEDPITAEMQADANHLKQKLQGKVVANHIQLQFFGCDIVL